MNINTEQCGAVCVVRPQGALVNEDAKAFTSTTLELLKANLGRVVIDTSHVPYVDSQGLEGLVDLAEYLAKSSASLKLCGINDTLAQVIALTGLSMQFDCYDDVQVAVGSFL
jgi:anti-anti-sigma factor